MKETVNKRIQWFHKAVLSGGYPNAPLLAKRFGISVSQAKRDIVFLKESLGAPLLYDSSKKGYCYTGMFSLPVAVSNLNDEEFSGLRSAPEKRAAKDPSAEEEKEEEADLTFLQLQIPYTAVLEIPDKLVALELKSYILSEEPKDQAIRRYRCEFHSVERFLGTLFSIDADVRILSPDWLRERFIKGAERVLRANLETPKDGDSE